MRRSLAPSQVFKRKNCPWDHEDCDSDEDVKRQRRKLAKNESQFKDMTSFPQHLGRQPFTSLFVNGCAKPTEHEARIKSILSKPFKVPIPNYQGTEDSQNFTYCLNFRISGFPILCIQFLCNSFFITYQNLFSFSRSLVFLFLFQLFVSSIYHIFQCNFKFNVCFSLDISTSFYPYYSIDHSFPYPSIILLFFLSFISPYI